MREKETFEDFGCRAEEGDWTIGVGGSSGFVGFKDKQNVRVFPDRWKIGRLNGKIEDCC